MRGGRILAAVLLLATATLGAGGCLFEPRTPEPPSGVARVYLPQTEALNVVENVRRAFAYGDFSGYEKQLSDAFTYHPDGQTQVEYPDIDWGSWGKDREVAFALGLFGRVSKIEMALPDSTIFQEPPSGNEVRWEYIYFTHVFEGDSETRYRGRAFFTLVQEGSFWYLSRWEDLSGEAAPEGGILPTMGALRGAIAGQTR